MKTLILILDEHVFEEMKCTTAELNISRNIHINEAIDQYNSFHKKSSLKSKLSRESMLTQKDSMNILHEFETIID